MLAEAVDVPPAKGNNGSKTKAVQRVEEGLVS